MRLLRRRKFVILAATILVPLVALVLSMLQEPVYEGSAEVLLSRKNVADSLTSTVQDPLAFLGDPERLGETQAELARVPEVAERTVKAAKLSGVTAGQLLGSSTVRPRASSDLLVFSVSDTEPAVAAKLASEYARQFTIYRRELDTTALVRARREVSTRLNSLGADQRDTPLYRSLVDKEQQLRTLEALQTSNAFLVKPATSAGQIKPRTKRNVALALIFGLIIGLALAYLWEALDTRLRSAEEIAELLGLPLLARIPEPPRDLQTDNSLVMLRKPRSPEAEAFRILNTNIQLATLDRPPESLLVSSALEGEGKSTTISNLAIATARAGRRVALVDLDLRKPYLHRFFDVHGASGLTSVVLGDTALDEAMTSIDLWPEGNRLPGEMTEATGGTLDVLVAGAIPPDPGEFVATRAVASLLEELKRRYDVVFVDSPPLLNIGDARVLSASVDGLLVVTRLRVVRRPILKELSRVVAAAPCPTLGFVLAGAEGEEGYGYGAYYYRAYGEEPAGVS